MSSILPRRLSLPVVQGALPAVRPLAPAVALRLLGEFQCTAGACEDTCCAGFTVAVDAVSHARLQVAYSHSAEDRARLRAALGPAPASADGSPESLTPHATLRLGADERCTLLSPAGLCSVQERHGEALLPDACSLFPRTTVLVGERLEVGATLACPEVARLVLGAEGALDQVDLPGGEDEVLPRALVGRTIDESDDAWTAAFAEVRATLLHLVRDAARPLPERLASMADLAERVRPFHFRGSPELAGASRVFAERRLARALALAADPLHADGVARDLAALDLPGEETLALAASMLLERRALPHRPRFAALLDACFGSLQTEATGAAERGQSVSAASLFAAYRRRREALHSTHGALLDELFARLWEHQLLRWPFTDSGSLLQHLVRLGLRVSAMRLLFFAHPAVAALADSHDRSASAASTLRAALAEVAQTFSRAVEHHVQFLRAAEEPVAREATLGRALLFAAF